MINEYAQKALAELRAAGAHNLPSEVQIQTSKNGARWKGTKRNGDAWELVKNSDESFDCTC